MIRKAEQKDISRIAEILVFVKRMNYRSIFNNDDFSFGELQVLNVAKEYENPDILNDIFLYDDGIVKGLIHIKNDEIVELYVDSFFQNQGIGAQLIKFAKEEYNVTFLWVIEKNSRAINFYEKQGFHLTNIKRIIEGTDEYDVKMEISKCPSNSMTRREY